VAPFLRQKYQPMSRPTDCVLSTSAAKCRAWLLIVTMLALVSQISGALTVQAQAPTITWSVPVKLSDDSQPNAAIRFPTIATDPWGGVHVFWGGDDVSAGSNGAAGSFIYYTHSDGQSWSEPIDIFMAQEGINFSMPYAVCDRKGTIHLLWAGSDGLYYSSVPAQEASNAAVWRPAQLIARGGAIYASRLVVDPDGVLHAVYQQRLPGTNVMYTRSMDNGTTWSDPVAISTLMPKDLDTPDMLRMVLDRKGILHVVWSQALPPEWVGRYVYYARSTDAGLTWSNPADLSDQPSGNMWNSLMDIAVDGQDGLHVVWNCGIGSPGRCGRDSVDHGQSWSNVRHLFGNLVGNGAWDAMITDGAGTAYWVADMRYPQGLYASLQAGNGWQDPPERVADEQHWSAVSGLHYPQMAVGLGNQIHLVMLSSDRGSVWYMRGQSSAASLTPPPRPTSTPSVTPTRSSTPTPRVTEEPTRGPTPFVQPDSVPPASATGGGLAGAVIWSAVPVLLLMLLVVVATGLRARSRI
jgi:hypothetical protein